MIVRTDRVLCGVSSEDPQHGPTRRSIVSSDRGGGDAGRVVLHTQQGDAPPATLTRWGEHRGGYGWGSEREKGGNERREKVG